MARSVVSLLNAAAYLQGIPEDDPDLLTELVRAAHSNPKAAPIGIPRQVTAPGVPAPVAKPKLPSRYVYICPDLRKCREEPTFSAQKIRGRGQLP